MPSTTCQCGRYFSSASFCFASSCSGVSFLRCGNSTSPCQPDRSLPLNSNLNPGGGLLSVALAFSSSSACTVTGTAARMAARVSSGSVRFMVILLGECGVSIAVQFLPQGLVIAEKVNAGVGVGDRAAHLAHGH